MSKITNVLDCYSAVSSYLAWCEKNDKTDSSIYEIMSFVKVFIRSFFVKPTNEKQAYVKPVCEPISAEELTSVSDDLPEGLS